MISHVYEKAEELKQCDGIDAVVAVVTDDERIESLLNSQGKRVVRVDDPVESGTERIFLAWQRYFANDNFDIVINVQGDEPLLEKEDLQELVSFHQKSTFDVATIVEKKTLDSEFLNPNRVKAVINEENGHCLYFSRSPVPCDRDGGQLKDWFLHIGIYSYRPEALKRFCEAPIAALENIEKLEQLRALCLGMTIGACFARHSFLGVDLPEDIKTVEGVLK